MKRILLDIETDTKHSHIWVVVTKDIDTGETKVWKQAKPLVEYLKDTTLIVAHNGISFDFPVLNRLWNTKIHGNQVFDTLIVSRLLDPSLENGHSLEAWGERLGLQKIDYRAVWLWMTNRSEKDTPKLLEFDEPHEALMDHYCVRDVDVLEVLYHHLVKELKDKEFSDQSVELEHKVAAIISKQEKNGFKLDRVYATNLLVDIQGKLDGIYEQMQQRWPPVTLERYSEKTGKRLKDSVVTFNPGSRQQIAEKLMELGWSPKKHTEKGQVIVDESVLSELKYPEAKLILDYLLLQKRISQIKSWFDCVGSDGRVHGRVITNGAITGRCTHSSPNLAQIPNMSAIYGPECRTCWTVEDRKVLVGVDLSGIELRCLAHYMQDAAWQHELLKGDVHWKNTQAFGLVPMGTVKDDSKEHKDARNLSKTLTYSVLYGAGPAKVGDTVGGGAREGKKLIDNFMRNTPALAKLVKKLAPFIKKGYVPGLDGRKVWVRSEHAALNSLLQSAGAIIAKQWIVCLTKNLTRAGIDYKLVAFVHDEVCIETGEKDAQEVVRIVVESARQAGEVLGFRCPVDAEGHVGKTWADVH